MRRLDIERGFPATHTYGAEVVVSDVEGFAVYVNGTMRFTVSFRDDMTVVALQGEDGPRDWITTAEDDE